MPTAAHAALHTQPAPRRAIRTPASRPATPVVRRLAGSREERVQAVLRVGPANDADEREAEHTAERCAAATGRLPLGNLTTVDRGSLLVLGRRLARF